MAAPHSARLYALGQRLKKSQMLKFACESVKPSQSIQSRDVPPWFALLDRITEYHERNLPNPNFPAPVSKCAHGVWMSARDVATGRASFCYGCSRGLSLASARGEALTERCARISAYEKSSQIYAELQAAIVAVEDDVIISGADAVCEEIAAREDALGDEHPLRFKARIAVNRSDMEDVVDYVSCPTKTTAGGHEIKQRMAAKETNGYEDRKFAGTRTRIAEHILPEHQPRNEGTNPQIAEGWSPSLGNQHGARYESCDGV